MPRTSSNSILDHLPAALRKSLLSRMELVDLPVNTMLLRPGVPPEFAHFMTSGITSVVTYMANGAGAEVGLIGKEGFVEAMHLLGSANSPTTAFIQVEGSALRIPFKELEKEVFATPVLLRRVLEFVQRHNFALTQLAACNGLHEIEERLARWVLMVQDRVDSPKFDLTQEFLASMLGASRTSVTLAAGSLQRSGLIEYKRGHIRILDAEKLLTAACECYPIVRDLTHDDR
ncbi:MAG TPA: Crp/Fnr family transcriptional regulator [Terracidiphilus sp.]|nr:Crp/Fnr family transcriptional regulator [Terracidiphilus sp.]